MQARGSKNFLKKTSGGCTWKSKYTIWTLSKNAIWRLLVKIKTCKPEEVNIKKHLEGVPENQNMQSGGCVNQKMQFGGC